MANLTKSGLLGAGVLFAAWTGGALGQTPPPDQKFGDARRLSRQSGGLHALPHRRSEASPSPAD